MILFPFRSNNPKKQPAPPPQTFEECLTAAFGLLCGNDSTVMSGIADCLADTAAYCAAHADALDRRGLQYVPEAAHWLQFIAAAELMLYSGRTAELDQSASPEDFHTALEAVLAANQIDFSLRRLAFDPHKKIPDWAAQFNQYAGQSGITVYFIDIGSDSLVLGAAPIADYAQAADFASQAGISVSCRAQS